MQNIPEVSVIIVCMNRPDNLRPCLESIFAHTARSVEVLVTAYLFSEANLAAMKAEFPQVTFLRSDEVRGFSENNNLALTQARGRYCFVLNDDTEFDSPVIDRLADDMDRLPQDTAIVSPRILNADGSLQLCGRPPYPAYRYALQQWHLYSEPKDDTTGKTAIFDEVFPTSNITGAAFLIRTELFRELGWFDERYFFTPEDIALSTLARSRGYGVFVDRGAVLTHKWKATASRISPAIRPAAIRGSLMFFSSGSRLRYGLLALPVWLAESGKYLKAAVLCLFKPSEDRRIKRDTFRHNAAGIFSRMTPKELFKKYYNG